MSSSAPSSSRPRPVKKKSSSSKSIPAPSAPVATPRAASPAGTSSSDDDEDVPARRAGSESSEIDEDGEDERGAGVQVESASGSKKRKAYSRFQPPVGTEQTKVPVSFASSPFEWDALSRKEGVELWAIRVPMGMKPSRLGDLVLHVPPRTAVDPHPAPHGSLKTSKAAFTLRPAASSSATAHPSAPAAQPTLADSTAMQVDPEAVGRGARVAADLSEVVGEREGARREEAREEEIRDELMRSGGEEMGGLKLLVPRMSKDGALFVAPKPVSQHLILLPSIDDAPAAPSADAILHPGATDPTLRPFPDFAAVRNTTPPPPPADSALANLPSREGKRAQPLDKLKRRNVPFGSGRTAPRVAAASSTARRDADGDVTMGEPGAEIDTPRKKKHKKHATAGADAVAAASTTTDGKKKSRKSPCPERERGDQGEMSHLG